MDITVIAKYEQAGRICAQAREYGANLIKPGASHLEVTRAIEAKIRELGGEPAFPVQIAVNHVAAHYCPDPDDTTLFTEHDLCKLDLGVHIEGYIADTAITVDLSGEHELLVRASREACEAALALVRPGVPVRVLGKAIQDAITKHGFAPIRNLGGHGLGRYIIHDHAISIPNYDNGDETPLTEGMVIAIEPFATTGKGQVQEQNVGNIYAHAQRKPVRNPYARKVQDEVQAYKGLPFTTHWLATPQKAAEMGLRELTAVGAVEVYPPLTEVQKGLVSQHEHSVIVAEKPIIYTKIV
jgi:methionyl aminopeptidase